VKKWLKSVLYPVRATVSACYLSHRRPSASKCICCLSHGWISQKRCKL